MHYFAYRPDAQCTLLPLLGPDYVAALPLKQLPGCGYTTQGVLVSTGGMSTVASILQAPWPQLCAVLGYRLAASLYELARGWYAVCLAYWSHAIYNVMLCCPIV
jgi:hypothetical protein